MISTILMSLVGMFVFQYDWNFSTALLFGAIASSTDPVAVVAILKDIGKFLNLMVLAMPCRQ